MQPVQEFSTADLAAMLRDVQRVLLKLTDHAEEEAEFRRIVILLVNQAGDCTHASVETAAHIARVTTRTIRKRIALGAYTLEVIPGTKRSGIPVEQLSRYWIPISIARRARAVEKRDRERMAAVSVSPRRPPR